MIYKLYLERVIYHILPTVNKVYEDIYNVRKLTELRLVCGNDRDFTFWHYVIVDEFKFYQVEANKANIEIETD